PSGARATSGATSSPWIALLPLRFSVGGTFLYAGIDKLLSPAFFTAGAVGSIQQQLLEFSRHSPLGGLLQVIQPWAVEIGFVVAVMEIGIGIGALSGFGFRLAAAGGAGLSLLFWLTASWATRPYYYGPDLPYALGWITLALAGHGDVLVPARARIPAADVPAGPGVVARRALLQAGVLASAAVVVTMLTVPLRRIGIGSETDSGLGGELSGTPTPAPTGPGATGSVATGPAATMPGSIVVATRADLHGTSSAAFTVPFTAPAPLPAGDPGVIVQLPNGTYVAFDAVCTHAGCTVEWDQPDGLLVCPCHNAVFDPSQNGAAVAGPTNTPLASLPLVFDAASGNFLLQAG
ncbi:MAG: Rieske 2Fe-2S domain-containing protein, partial [Candidatus Limnocylindrales bacterium]